MKLEIYLERDKKKRDVKKLVRVCQIQKIIIIGQIKKRYDEWQIFNSGECVYEESKQVFISVYYMISQ